MRDIDKTIRNASAQELERELKNPCGGDRGHWRHSPHPLYRAAQLGRADLMEKWMKWGCSLRGLHGGSYISYRTQDGTKSDSYDTRPIVSVLFNMNSNLITLLGDYNPHLLEDVLHDVVRYDSKQLHNTDLFRGLTQMRTQKIDTTELVSNMIVVAIGAGHGPLKQLLEFNNGVIAPSESWKSQFSLNGYSIDIRRFKDSEAYKRVNALPSDVISCVDATVLLEMGLPVTIHSLKMHLELMERSDQFVVRRKKTNWDTLRAAFQTEWKSWSFKDDEWMAIFDSLLENVVDIRSTGRYTRSTIFSFIRHVSLPEHVLSMLAVRAWEASPQLMHLPLEKSIGIKPQKQSFIEMTEHCRGALENIRSTLMSLESHDRLQRVMDTQTKKIKAPAVVHKRRM